jgi:hypothetical protein
MPSSTFGTVGGMDDHKKRVYLHVGVHKSGTPYLQSMLLRHRAALREAGVLYPGANSRMFLAAVEVRGTHKGWGLRRRDVRGSWDGICRSARHYDGVTVVSHELFAAAAPRQVIAAMTMMRDLDVHILVSTADPESSVTMDAVRRWRRAVPPQNLHILHAPKGPEGHDILWRQLAATVGFDPVPEPRAEPVTSD